MSLAVLPCADSSATLTGGEFARAFSAHIVQGKQARERLVAQVVKCQHRLWIKRHVAAGSEHASLIRPERRHRYPDEAHFAWRSRKSEKSRVSPQTVTMVRPLERTTGAQRFLENRVAVRNIQRNCFIIAIFAPACPQDKRRHWTTGQRDAGSEEMCCPDRSEHVLKRVQHLCTCSCSTEAITIRGHAHRHQHFSLHRFV